MSYGCEYQVGIENRCEVHQEHTILKVLYQIGGHLQRKSRLAYTGGAGQRYQAHSCLAEQLLYGCPIAPAAHQWRERGGQVGLPQVNASPGSAQNDLARFCCRGRESLPGTRGVPGEGNESFALVAGDTKELGQQEGYLPGWAAVPGLYLLESYRRAADLIGKLVMRLTCPLTLLFEPCAKHIAVAPVAPYVPLV
jgi:hypothetical protein